MVDKSLRAKAKKEEAGRKIVMSHIVQRPSWDRTLCQACEHRTEWSSVWNTPNENTKMQSCILVVPFESIGFEVWKFGICSSSIRSRTCCLKFVLKRLGHTTVWLPPLDCGMGMRSGAMLTARCLDTCTCVLFVNGMHRVELCIQTTLCCNCLATVSGSPNPFYSMSVASSIFAGQNAMLMKWVVSVFSNMSPFNHGAIIIDPTCCTSKSFLWLPKSCMRQDNMKGWWTSHWMVKRLKHMNLWKLQSKIWLYGRTQLVHSLIFFSGKLLLIWYLWVLFC